MPKVKAYRRKNGTLVRAHSRGTISVGRFKGRVRGSTSLAHLRRSPGGPRTPNFLSTALSDWESRGSYMDNRGDLRYYGHTAKARGKKKGSIAPYSARVRNIYGFGSRQKDRAKSFDRSMAFSNRARRKKRG